MGRPSLTTKLVRMDRLFDIKSGDFHAVGDLDAGDTPLVSCGDVNHGFIGRFDIPTEFRYCNTITVAYNGQPLTAKFRPYEFGAKDDIGILLPHEPLSDVALIYIAALLNSMCWRFSYGRKCFRTKLGKVQIKVPVVIRKGLIQIDEAYISDVVCLNELDKRPKPVRKRMMAMPAIKWKARRLNEIFDLQRGDFHSLKELGPGSCATVSRTENDNGVVGYFERPEGAEKYSAGLITVSTVSGDAFVQMEDFIATDNVIVCVPHYDMRVTTSYFIASMINHQKWRYGYGRQCYREKLSALIIQVPWRNDRIDESAIAKVVCQQPYWSFVSKARMSIREGVT